MFDKLSPDKQITLYKYGYFINVLFFMSIYKEEKLCIYDENEIDQSNARIQNRHP